MSKSKSVKCKICDRKYVSKSALIDHIERTHSSSIPKDWNAARYENYLRTGKTEGRCVYCKTPTGWNNATGKYNRMCGSEACKKKARELANKNYIGLHGKPYSINDPEQQKKMVYGRKNSGKYIFEDEDTGKKYVAMYDSSYGKDFFEMIDTFLNWDGSDIIAPSPHTYWYEYEGKKHFYIPDAYSTSLNLEIELKDGGDNPNKHPKIQAIDKVKEQKKDAVMESLKGQVNYIKICNKDYTGFFKLLSELRAKDTCQLPKWDSRLESITESFDIFEEKVVYGKEIDSYDLDRDGKIYREKVSLTGKSYDDVRAKNIASYDDKMAFDIINSENIVEAYNAYMQLDIDRLGKIVEQITQNSDVDPKDIHSGVDFSIISDVLALMESNTFKTKEELVGYIKGQYFDQISDPNILRDTLRLRYNWNRRVTNLLERMLRENYLALGYTIEEATQMISKLKGGGAGKREVVDKIVDDIIRNPNLYRGSSNNSIDLTDFGAGKIYLSDDQASLINNKEYHKAMLTGAVMYAFRYDIVIVGHGRSVDTIEKQYLTDLHSYSDDYRPSEYNTHNNLNEIELFNDTYGTTNYGTTNYGRLIDNKTPERIKRAITNIDKAKNKYNIDLSPDECNTLYQKLNNVKQDYYFFKIDDDKLIFRVKHQLELFRISFDKPIETADEALRKIDLFSHILREHLRVIHYFNTREIWRSQKTKIGDHKSTINTETIIRNAIKDNKDARTIMVLNCNPDHIKLSKDLENDKKHLIHISNNVTLVDMCTTNDVRAKISESVEYEYESDEFEFDSILESVENTIKDFAFENGIDYNDNEVLLEAMTTIYNEEEILQEGFISKAWQVTISFIKKIIKAIVGLFKAIINVFKKIFNAIKNLIRKLLGMPTINHEVSYIAMEGANIDTFKPRNNKEIENKIRKSCEKMGKELQKLSKNQTSIMNEIKKDAEKQARESVNESSIKNIERNESFSYYHLEKEKINHSGGWDEEQYFKTLPDAVKQELSHLSYKGCNGHTRQGKAIRHVYTLGKDYSAIYLGSILITWADWYDHCESPEYNWIDTPGINMALIDEDINPINKSIAINESSDIIKVAKTKPNLIERNLLLKDPMLNYDKLMEYYRKKLFYEKLSDTEWNALYNELNNVKEYLQRVANEQNREHNKRMVYESKKALNEVDRFIAYMEDVGNEK